MNNLREEMLIDMRYDWTSPKTKCLVVGFDDWNVRIYYKALDAIHISKCIQQYITGIVNDWGFDAEFPCMGAIRAWTAGPYCVCSTQFGNDPKRMHLIVLNIIPKPPIYKMTGKIDMRAVVKFDHGPNEKPKIKFQCMN
jgi:hypothetical protein